MFTIPKLLAAGALLTLAAVPAVTVAQRIANRPPADQPLPLPGPRPAPASIERWQARKFGMFIHFGLYSVAGGVWKGQRVEHGYSEQIMAEGNLPPEEYAALARRFDPTKFDADAIVALAKAAGMRFIVLTAKHHDGFNLFRTAQTTYSTVDGAPARRDLVKELADACRRGGLAFGVYYSTIDWHQPKGNVPIVMNGNPITADQEAFNVAQLRELLGGRYGRVSEIWFDMGKPTPAQSARFAQTVHALQPQTMVSGRVWNYEGDFTVLGDNQEPDVGIEEPWQSPASMFPETWGFRSWQRRGDPKAKIEEHVARLVRVASGGGNYILNIGPEGDGSVVPFEATVLRGIGQWLQVNGRAIYGTRRQPFEKLDFGHATVGDGMLYLFVDRMPADSVLRLPRVVDTKFGTASVLGASGARAPVTSGPDGAAIDARALVGLRTGAFMPVVAVELASPLRVRPPAIAPNARGGAELAQASATRFLNYNGYGYEDPNTVYKLQWHAALPVGRYTVTIRYEPSRIASVMTLFVDGRPTNVTVGMSGVATADVVRDPRAHPYAMQIAVTPAAPFYKGEKLPVTIDRIEVAPAR